MKTIIALLVIVAATIVLSGCPPKDENTNLSTTSSPWQSVANGRTPDPDVAITERMPVPGGWLYRSIARHNGIAVSQTFVPDANSPAAEMPPTGKN